MDVLIKPTRLSGSVAAISSKSDAHRTVIAAAFADKKTVIKTDISQDIQATANCIKALSGDCEYINGSIVVSPVTGVTDEAVLDCGESGSTARFLLPSAAVICNNAVLKGEGRLPQRPFSTLTQAMRAHGCTVDSDSLPMQVSGKLQSGIYELPGDISSQYVSGLLFALPQLAGDSEIVLCSPLQSAGYVDMTLKTLLDFKIKVDKTKTGFYIKGDQHYISPGEIVIEGDWSNAAFFIAAGTIGGEVTVSGLDMQSLQGDREIYKILKDAGANIGYDSGVVTCSGGELKGFEVDVSQIPDLVPVLSVIAAAAKGRTRITNAHRLRIKESDRLVTTERLIKDLGGKISQTEDGLLIEGTGTLEGGQVDGAGDHRIVMAAAVASVICRNEVKIKGANAADKSYPRFFEHFKSLGGNAIVL